MAAHFDPGEDLLDGLREVLREHGMRTGYVPTITGQLSRARVRRFGAALWQGDVLRLAGAETAEEHFDPAASYQECFDAAIRHFVAAVRSGSEFETSAADNLKTLALVEQAYAAAEERTA